MLSSQLLIKDKSIVHTFADDITALCLFYHVGTKTYMTYDTADELENALKDLLDGPASNAKYPEYLVPLPRSSKGIKMSLLLFDAGEDGPNVDQLAFHCSRHRSGISYLVKHLCFNCRSMKSLHVCSNCRIARYCSEECQKKAWVTHKKLCKLKKAKPTRTAIKEYDEKIKI